MLHRDATGDRRGRRWGTTQLNRAMHLWLVAQFQRYCLMLHDEAIEKQVAVAAPQQRKLVRRLMSSGRKLSTSTPRPDNLGADFARVGIPLVQLLRGTAAGTADVMYLSRLSDFRNAIAHGNEDEIQAVEQDAGVEPRIRPTKRSLSDARVVLDRLVERIDALVADELAGLLETSRPW